jgi:hypothetical protein
MGPQMGETVFTCVFIGKNNSKIFPRTTGPEKLKFT